MVEILNLLYRQGELTGMTRQTIDILRPRFSFDWFVKGMPENKNRIRAELEAYVKHTEANTEHLKALISKL